MVKYKVTIVEIKESVPHTEQSWKKVVDVPDEKHDELYRYVTTETTEDVATKVFEQTLEAAEVNLTEVIKAVNGL